MLPLLSLLQMSWCRFGFPRAPHYVLLLLSLELAEAWRVSEVKVFPPPWHTTFSMQSAGTES